MSGARPSKRLKLSHSPILFKEVPDQREEIKIETTVKHCQFASGNTHATLLIHGGCFVKGDETWNKEQAAAIAKKCSLDIFTLDFSKTSLTASLEDIKAFYQHLYQTYQGRVGLIGCSSGGFLTLKMLTDISVPNFVVLVCPVMDPAQREDLLPEDKHSKNIRDNQRAYFGARPYPVAEGNDLPLHIIAAKQDENVPLKLIEAEIKRFPKAILHKLDGEHALNFKSYKAVNDIIQTVAEQAREAPRMSNK